MSDERHDQYDASVDALGDSGQPTEAKEADASIEISPCHNAKTRKVEAAGRILFLCGLCGQSAGYRGKDGAVVRIIK